MRKLFTLILLGWALIGQAQPIYRVDASWPQHLPDNMILGQVSGIDVAPDDTIWVLHRPKTLAADEMGSVQRPPLSTCCQPAPAVLQFSQGGELLQAWGGPVWDASAGQWRQPAQEWPQNEHGIFVDAEGFVWVGATRMPAGGMSWSNTRRKATMS